MLLNKINHKFFNFIYRSLIRKTHFTNDITIISNNCWGGGVYQDLNLPFLSPTVGLFFYAPCYIKFVFNLQHYFSHELTFKKVSKYKEANDFRYEEKLNYPIGQIDDIEIHFQHYSSDQEANEKWTRRVSRVNLDNLFFKMCDRDLCTNELAIKFDQLLHKKVFFSSKQLDKVNSCLRLSAYEGKESVGDLYNEKWAYIRQFSIIEFLTGNTRRNKILQRIGNTAFFLTSIINR